MVQFSISLRAFYRRRQWHPIPLLLLGKSHGCRSLVSCSPWGLQSRTRLSDFTFTFHFHTLEKEVATHSSILAGESQGWGSLVNCCLWGRTESDTTEVTQQQAVPGVFPGGPGVKTTCFCCGQSLGSLCPLKPSKRYRDRVQRKWKRNFNPQPAEGRTQQARALRTVTLKSRFPFQEESGELYKMRAHSQGSVMRNV